MSVMGQQPLTSRAYGHALNFWDPPPPSSDKATGIEANINGGARRQPAEAAALHGLVCNLPQVGGASGATQDLGGAGQEKGVDEAGTLCRPRARRNYSRGRAAATPAERPQQLLDGR